MTEHATAAQVMVADFIMEGVFERYPELKVGLIECGFGWLPSLGWRLDKHWKRLKDEVPHLKKAPSEYIREHFFVSVEQVHEGTARADVCRVILAPVRHRRTRNLVVYVYRHKIPPLRSRKLRHETSA